MKIEINCAYSKMVAVGDLKPNPMNPNVHTDHQIEVMAEIIKYTGWRDPITVSNRSGMIVRGHGRLMVAMFLGCKKVPVDFQDYDNEQMELADLVADNVIQDLSELDIGMVKGLMEKIADKSNWIMTAFSEDELDKIMGDHTGFLDGFRQEKGSDEIDTGGGDPARPPAKGAGPGPAVTKYFKLPMLFDGRSRDFIIQTVSKYQDAHGINLSSEALVSMCRAWKENKI